jgi:pilus assembly protein Flp/PilA
MLKQLKKLVKSEDGQAVTEYGVIIGLIVVMVVAVIGVFNVAITALFAEIVVKIQAALP